MHNLLPILQTNHSTTRLDPVLRSLDVSKSFRTSEDSANYIQTKEIPGNISGVVGAALFPTESGFELAFGEWEPYNTTIYRKRDPAIGDKKWQYTISTQQWADEGITLRNWVGTNTAKQVSSSMTAWIPSLRKGFLFGGTVSVINETMFLLHGPEQDNGLITYDQATNTWTNESTQFGGIYEGGLVPITTAKDEVLIQLGGAADWASDLVCYSAY